MVLAIRTKFDPSARKSTARDDADKTNATTQSAFLI
jgi:hypothetical protein